ncbi:iron-sulfur cluster biosynthesis transcriptional regulator SufR [Leptolyngbya sp. FACHB-261]|uniref:iron-sulfur cluster biosynthesis transcriptional regulator SufR n=1 Tax=Leptolyngbya sp. FACHB-261 TaxID=2692806 RepID=UPI001689F844|nr:iron-sulfur cluster biosynthesis transcriptional regulator SufR [Leptolyngbya sp. FACHB-261]MBD2101854.1 iron-sulfur cluster biosynthesis transcriptional regulator SufR [Leptolyngbya sp. FACHB-261]
MTATEPSTKQDILRHLRQHPQSTAHELAERLEITVQAVRRHLKDLETENLVRHTPVQVGMGRPQHQYSLTEEAGRTQFPQRYDEFAVGMLAVLSEEMGPEQLGSLLHKQWQRKALSYRAQIGTGPLQERVAILAQLRQTEGYMAEYHAVEGGRFLLVEHHCAISQLAESFPTVCGHELEMFSEALSGVDQVKVERTHWMVDGEHRCGYLISVRVPELEEGPVSQL